MVTIIIDFHGNHRGIRIKKTFSEKDVLFYRDMVTGEQYFRLKTGIILSRYQREEEARI